MLSPPEFLNYGGAQEPVKKLFEMFRSEIGRSTVGWVDVLPFNDNLVFLKGLDGGFDWVVRNQRDEEYPQNPLHPIFALHELPRAMKCLDIQARLYYERGSWLEKRMHEAEAHHYRSGGTIATWPGERKLLERYLIEKEGYKHQRQPKGFRSGKFVAHDVGGMCLMVSPLITIDEFWPFYELAVCV